MNVNVGRMGQKASTRRRAIAVLVAGVSAVGLAACGSSTGPDVKPTTARVQVEGTAPGALQLVVSTDFYEIYDEFTFEPVQVVSRADTFLIDLPYDETVDLSDDGNVLVALTNHDAAPAQVRMRVHLDSGQQPYDRSANMSLSGTLRYVFVFLEVVI